MGLINAFSFYIIGFVCDATHADTYARAWERSFAWWSSKKNPKSRDWGSLVVKLAVVGKCFLGNWSFSIMIADTCQPLLETFGIILSKAHTLILITAFILLPLCVARRLSSLAFFSVISTMGTIFTAITMAIRYVDGSYQEGGKYYEVR